MTTKLVLATRNDHKVEELREILKEQLPGLDVSAIQSARSFDLPEPVENAVTFAGNALIKARQVATETGIAALADDSGICVDVLGGAPGIFSARWSGGHGDDAANLDLLLAQLADVPREHRGANFTCAAALVLPDGREFVKIGQVFGSLRYERAGCGGFGYDPIFQAEGMDVTLAELDVQQKNKISHRYQAFSQIAPLVAELIHW
ncbi:XTP/dITP diphosphohydrolase [Arcanobacterium pluranimalium]|uniref:RdgB/HAM1 family non-canonical purine NTP pyrophosphatase n=1 Tax=Arcanobacterium pluranimalium TaxID=108028 RepID=UPI00195D6E90|nr:RdgB/HAM1 family non-canonical purine NTP pyrophosphatase [Arcanobacterium pluranimalium]MBM7825196.1 XTP/dITP diphosphohydrolase [Arcanobacterium pluranimalium]